MMTEAGYSISELMVCVFAREVKDGDLALSPGLRTAVVVATLQLARNLHAPNANCYLGVALNPTGPLSMFSTDFSRMKGAERIAPCASEFFDKNYQGLHDFTMVGGMQVDKYGNTNLVCIGDYYHPKLRLAGSTGCDALGFNKRLYIWMNEHTKRSFVERVDFISCAGYIDGPGAREKAGIKWGGPVLVVSPLAVMDFDPETKRMGLKTIHCGVSIENVVENTGFELLIPTEVPQTIPPSKEELHVLRTKVDPNGILRKNLPYG